MTSGWPALAAVVLVTTGSRPAFAGDAAPIEAVSDDAGVVTTRALTAASSERALALIRDPALVHRISGDDGVLTATPASELGAGCVRLTYARSSLVGKVAYTAKACPTAAGIRCDLIDSTTFRAMSSEWTVREAPGGAELTYVYHADVALPVPAFVIRRSTEAAVAEMMTRVVERLDVN